MEQQTATHICDSTFQNVLQHFVLPFLPAAVLGNLRATCTLLQTRLDEDSFCIWASASSGDHIVNLKKQFVTAIYGKAKFGPSVGELKECCCLAKESDNWSCVSYTVTPLGQLDRTAV